MPVDNSRGAGGPEAVRELASIVGRGRCRAGRLDLELYSYDSSPFIHRPDVLVMPGSVDEAARVVALCRARGWPLTARGAGTSLSGGAVPRHGGVAMAMTRLDRILAIDPLEETALVEAGVVNLDLQDALAGSGFMFAPDPASQKASTIGGNIAENAGGVKGVKYGITKHHALGLELILDDGTLARTGAMADRPAAAGPDHTGLFLGSEGTLAVVARALLKITPLPGDFRTVSAVFGSLPDSGRAVASIIGAGIVPTALEIMDRALVAALADLLPPGFPRDAEAMLLIEIDGLGPELDAQMEAVAGLCRRAGAGGINQARSPEERAGLWLARRSANGALGRIKRGSIVEDVAVPVERLPEMLALVQRTAAERGVTLVQMAHAGDGNLHPHMLYDPDDEAEYRRCLDAGAVIFRAALGAGGCITGEHGVGLEKVGFMEDQFTADELGLMGDLKRGLDPGGVLNPGKLLPARWQTFPEARRPEGAAAVGPEGGPGPDEGPDGENVGGGPEGGPGPDGWPGEGTPGGDDVGGGQESGSAGRPEDGPEGGLGTGEGPGGDDVGDVPESGSAGRPEDGQEDVPEGGLGPGEGPGEDDLGDDGPVSGEALP